MATAVLALPVAACGDSGTPSASDPPSPTSAPPPTVEVVTVGGAEPDCPTEGEEWEDAKLYIEHNATDADTGVHGFFGGEAWRELCVADPDGNQIWLVDPQGQLWVTEHDYMPKRVSVWSPDGKFIRAFYGPGKYGGGGQLDSRFPDRFYYADEGKGTLEFRLDWEEGTSELVAVRYRRDPDGMPFPFRTAENAPSLKRNS